jgi:D-lactate dehydrogenase (cytochrome)
MKLIRDQDIIEGYLSDASNTRGHAEALAVPRSTAEVSELLIHCQAQGIPLTVSARRTSTTGGPVPQGGWLLSTEKMDAIESLHQVQGGCYLGAYQSHVEAQGWFFPPDPTSRHECSIGAAIACNASGARTFKYGPIRPWIDWVELVLPTGEVIEADRKTPVPASWPAPSGQEPRVKTAAGFYPSDNLLDLLIGQEGTLGIITRARTHLIRPPEDVMSMVVFFPDLQSCLDFVVLCREGAKRPGRPAAPEALNPRAIEFFDSHALDLIRDRVEDIPDGARSALFIEVEHPEEDPPLDRWCEILEEHSPLADETILTTDATGLARLHRIRHAIPAAVNEVIVSNGMPKIGTDFAVPDGALREMMHAYSKVSLPHILFGHIGDNHLHLNLLPRTPTELSQARALYRELALEAVSLGGTVSAEHGIGKLKRALLAEMVGARVLEDFRALKRTLDPAWILGRGTMLDPPSEPGNTQADNDM